MTEDEDELPDERQLPRRRVLEASAALSGGALASANATGSTPGGVNATGTKAAEQAGALTCGDEISGELTAEDATFLDERFGADFYELGTPDAEYLTVSMEAAVDYENNTYPEPILYLLNADGTVVASGSQDYVYYDGEEYVYSQLSALRPPEGEGPYTVVATAQYPENYFEYTLTADCVTLDPASIDCGETVSGRLRNDDPSGLVGPNRHFDAYAFEGTSGEVVEVTVETPNPNNAGGPDNPRLGDSTLYLLGPSGRIVARGDGFDSFDAVLRQYLQRDGTYTVVLTSYRPNDEFRYDLTLECSTLPSAAPIECGETLSSSLTADDPESVFGFYQLQELYRFQGTAGEEATITVRGVDPYAYADIQLYLIGPDGSVVARSGYGSGSENLLIRVLSRTGEYRVAVVADSYSLYYTDELEYELGLTCDPTPQRCEITCAERLECGSRVAGELGRGNGRGFRGPRYLQDVYCFDAREGETVTVSMSVAEPGYPRPYLYLLGPQGDIVAQYDEDTWYLDRSGTATIQEYTVEQGGTHKLVATSRWEADLFDYSILLQCEGC